MESNLRGTLEIQCDYFLTEESLQARVGYLNQLKQTGLFNSFEDALVGALIESLTASCATMKILRGSKLTGDDMRAIREICMNRAADIKSKISMASNL